MAGSRLLICAAVLALLSGPALAQVAASSGSRVVTDPETRRVRVINPALDRPDPYEGQTGLAVAEPIILKKPQKKKPRPAPPKPAPSFAETPQAEPQRAAEPAAQASPSSSLGAEDYVSPFGDAEPAPAPPPKKPVEKPKLAPAPKAAPAQSEIPFSFGGHDEYAHPQQKQAAAPKPASDNLVRGDNGKTRNIRINFIAGKAEPSAEVATALQALAQDLTSELQAKPGRLLLQAYAGAKGDKSSDARRLSLKRALSVRQLLIDSGVPSDRIDVRAMGGASDGDRLDRVDVSLHG